MEYTPVNRFYSPLYRLFNPDATFNQKLVDLEVFFKQIKISFRLIDSPPLDPADFNCFVRFNEISIIPIPLISEDGVLLIDLEAAIQQIKDIKDTDYLTDYQTFPGQDIIFRLSIKNQSIPTNNLEVNFTEEYPFLTIENATNSKGEFLYSMQKYEIQQRKLKRVMLDSDLLNQATVTVTRLIKSFKSSFNNDILDPTENYFFEDCQIGQNRYISPRAFYVRLKYSKEVHIINSRAQFQKMLTDALSLIGGLFAIWRVFKWFLMMRYQNRQARMV